MTNWRAHIKKKLKERARERKKRTIWDTEDKKTERKRHQQMFSVKGGGREGAEQNLDEVEGTQK